MGQKMGACQGNLPLIIILVVFAFLVDYGHVILNKKFHFPRVTPRSAIVFSLHSHNSHRSKRSLYGLRSLL